MISPRNAETAWRHNWKIDAILIVVAVAWVVFLLFPRPHNGSLIEERLENIQGVTSSSVSTYNMSTVAKSEQVDVIIELSPNDINIADTAIAAAMLDRVLETTWVTSSVAPDSGIRVTVIDKETREIISLSAALEAMEWGVDGKSEPGGIVEVSYRGLSNRYGDRVSDRFDYVPEG